MKRPSVLLIGKGNDSYCERAKELVCTVFPEHEFLLGQRGDPLPERVEKWEGDFILSYLSPWIIPERLLNRAKRGALNFHPGPPEYPGIGCTNFAIYNQEATFGVTCHHMAPKVDTGPIVAVRRFPIYDTDTVFTLTHRCYAFIQTLFQEIVAKIALAEVLPASDDRWTRLPYMRRELNELCRVKPDMSAEEVARRVKAVTFPGAPGAFTEVAGFRFIMPTEK